MISQVVACLPVSHRSPSLGYINLPLANKVKVNLIKSTLHLLFPSAIPVTAWEDEMLTSPREAICLVDITLHRNFNNLHFLAERCKQRSGGILTIGQESVSYTPILRGVYRRRCLDPQGLIGYFCYPRGLEEVTHSHGDSVRVRILWSKLPQASGHP